MVMSLKPDLLKQFPRLANSGYQITSPPSVNYNCVSFVFGDRRKVWWPNEYGFWPVGCPREDTVDAIVECLTAHGFVECADATFESGVERAAIYAKNGSPEHVALQPTDRQGRWISKLGDEHDIMHDLEALKGGDYGDVVCFLKRPKKRKSKRRGRRSA